MMMLHRYTTTRRWLPLMKQFSTLNETDFVKKAESYLEQLTEQLDQSEHQIFDDIEYSAGVLNIEMVDGRSFVLNKQTPNK